MIIEKVADMKQQVMFNPYPTHEEMLNERWRKLRIFMRKYWAVPVTRARAANMWGVSKVTATKTLNELVGQGELYAELRDLTIRGNVRTTYVYFIPGDVA